MFELAVSSVCCASRDLSPTYTGELVPPFLVRISASREGRCLAVVLASDESCSVPWVSGIAMAIPMESDIVALPGDEVVISRSGTDSAMRHCQRHYGAEKAISRTSPRRNSTSSTCIILSYIIGWC